MNKYISKILISVGFITLFFIGIHSASALTFSANNSGNDCYSSWTIPVGCINNPGYFQNNYNNNGYNSSSSSNPYDYNNQYASNSNRNATYGNSKTPIVNNYYYSGSKISSTSEKVSTKTSNSVKSTKDKVDSKNTKEDIYNNTDNSKLRANNGLSALALNTSTTATNFLPHTFWQWLIVIFLILVIVILMRLINKTRVHNKSEIDSIH